MHAYLHQLSGEKRNGFMAVKMEKSLLYSTVSTTVSQLVV